MVCINSIVASLLFRSSPEELRFVMIDPCGRAADLHGLPHLAAPVVHDLKKVILALKWVVNEMEKRYQILPRSAPATSAASTRAPRKPAKQDQAELPLDETGEGFAVEMDEEVSVPREDDIEIPDNRATSS